MGFTVRKDGITKGKIPSVFLTEPRFRAHVCQECHSSDTTADFSSSDLEIRRPDPLSWFEQTKVLQSFKSTRSFSNQLLVGQRVHNIRAKMYGDYFRIYIHVTQNLSWIKNSSSWAVKCCDPSFSNSTNCPFAYLSVLEKKPHDHKVTQQGHAARPLTLPYKIIN